MIPGVLFGYHFLRCFGCNSNHSPWASPASSRSHFQPTIQGVGQCSAACNMMSRELVFWSCEHFPGGQGGTCMGIWCSHGEGAAARGKHTVQYQACPSCVQHRYHGLLCGPVGCVASNCTEVRQIKVIMSKKIHWQNTY